MQDVSKYRLAKLSVFTALVVSSMQLVAIALPEPAPADVDRPTIPSLDLALQQNPQNVDAYIQRGRLHAKSHQHVLAISDYTEAIRLDSTRAIAYNDRAMVKLTLKDYLGAYLDYNQVIRLLPAQAVAYNNRAAVRHQLGDCQGSIADLRTAAALFYQQGDEYNYQRTLANLKYFQRSSRR